MLKPKSQDIREWVTLQAFQARFSGLLCMAQSCVERKARLKIRYCSPDGDVKKKILVNDVQLCPPGVAPDTYDKLFTIPKSEDWAVFDAGLIDLKVGENYIRFYNGWGGDNILVDCIELEQAD